MFVWFHTTCAICVEYSTCRSAQVSSSVVIDQIVSLSFVFSYVTILSYYSPSFQVRNICYHHQSHHLIVPLHRLLNFQLPIIFFSSTQSFLFPLFPALHIIIPTPVLCRHPHLPVTTADATSSLPSFSFGNHFLLILLIVLSRSYRSLITVIVVPIFRMVYLFRSSPCGHSWGVPSPHTGLPSPRLLHCWSSPGHWWSAG